MRKIFPKERIISGVIIFSFLLFLFFLMYPLEISFDKSSIFIIVTFILVLCISINLIVSHTSYNSEFVVLFSIFSIKKIKMDEITQISRLWEGSGKGLQLKWYIHYVDKKSNREIKRKIYLSENYASENIKRFIETIRKRNPKFILSLGIK